MKKIALGFLCNILMLGLVTGCSDSVTDYDDAMLRQDSSSICEADNPSWNSKVDLINTHKVAGKDIYIDVPNWDFVEFTHEMTTAVYKVHGNKYVSVTDSDEKVDSLSEAYDVTWNIYKENMYRYQTIYSLTIKTEKEETINEIDVYKFEGTMNCKSPIDPSTNYDAYVIGYSFVIDDIPCSVIGSVQDVNQEESTIDEVKATVEAMMETVRNKR